MAKSKSGKGKYQKMAVDKYGVQSEVLKLYKENTPATKISSILKEREIDISPLGINRWLKKQKEIALQSDSEKTVQEFKEIMIDYKTEIMDILDEVKEMKTLAKEKGDMDIYIKLINQIFKGLELVAKVMGDMKQSGNNLDVNIVINEISDKIFQDNKYLRNKLHGNKIIDIEAEIMEEDKEREQELNKGE